MEPEAWTRLALKVRDSGAGLYPYLSSGKSSAMAISFRPISFHCSSKGSEGLGAGLGSVFLASWARRGCTVRQAVSRSAKSRPSRFIASLLFVLVPIDADGFLLAIRRGKYREVSPVAGRGESNRIARKLIIS